MKKAGYIGYIYDFSVDYEANAVDDIKDIHKYFMGKKYSMNTLNVIKNVYHAKNY